MGMFDELTWHVLQLNPEPWAVGPLSVARGKGGKFFPRMGANQQLVSYQEAVRAELKRQQAEMVRGPFGEYDAYELVFMFHQVLAKYLTASGRQSQQKQADLTNLTKATEDAIQGILIPNDTLVEKSTLYVQRSEVEDAVPYVIIGVGQYLGINPNELPPEVWDKVDLAVIEHRKLRLGDREVMNLNVLHGVGPDEDLPF